MRRPLWRRATAFRGPLVAALTAAVIGLIAGVAGWPAPAGAPLSGRPAVVDGDTLRFGRERVRLVGIDAPELQQTCTGSDGKSWPCGRSARAYVVGLTTTGVTCARQGRDRYGRTLAKCAADGADLGGKIVAAGWAVADLDYLGAEATARLARRGIWSGSFTTPAVWRRSHDSSSSWLWDWITALFT